MLLDAGVEVAGDADVERAGVAAHDVGVSGWHGEDAISSFLVRPLHCHPERSAQRGVEGPRGCGSCCGCLELSGEGVGAGFGVRKVLAVWVIPAASGSFDCGAHGEAVSTSAQDDRIWVG